MKFSQKNVGTPFRAGINSNIFLMCGFFDFVEVIPKLIYTGSLFLKLVFQKIRRRKLIAGSLKE